MHKIITSGLIVVALLLGGCAALEHVESSPTTAALTLQYGTLKYIGDDTGKAQRVYDTAGSLATGIEDESVSLALLDDQMRAAINWQSLDAADTLLLNTLLAQLRAELESRMGTGLLSAEDRVRLQQVLTWVRDAALVAGARAG